MSIRSLFEFELPLVCFAGNVCVDYVLALLLCLGSRRDGWPMARYPFLRLRCFHCVAGFVLLLLWLLLLLLLLQRFAVVSYGDIAGAVVFLR